MKVEAYSGFEFWVEDSNQNRLAERKEAYVKKAQLNTLIVPLDTDLVFCIKKCKRDPATIGGRDDYVAYLSVDGRELGIIHIKRGNGKCIRIKGVFEEIDGELNSTPLRLRALPTTDDVMAPALPHTLGKISLAIYKVTLKNRKSEKIPLTPFIDLVKIVVPPSADEIDVNASPQVEYGIVRGESDRCAMEETRQKYLVDQSVCTVNREDDPWLTMEFAYKPDLSVSAPQQVPLAQVSLLQQKVNALEGKVGDLQRKLTNPTPVTPVIALQVNPTPSHLQPSQPSATRPSATLPPNPSTNARPSLKRERTRSSSPLSEITDRYPSCATAYLYGRHR